MDLVLRVPFSVSWGLDDTFVDHSRRRAISFHFMSFHFISFLLFIHGSRANLHRILCRGPCKKIIITNLKRNLQSF